MQEVSTSQLPSPAPADEHKQPGARKPPRGHGAAEAPADDVSHPRRTTRRQAGAHHMFSAVCVCAAAQDAVFVPYVQKTSMHSAWCIGSQIGRQILRCLLHVH